MSTTTRSRTGFWAVLAFAFLLLTSSLPAQVNPLAGEALQHFEEGKRLFEQERFSDAGKLFKKSKGATPKADRPFVEPWIGLMSGAANTVAPPPDVLAKPAPESLDWIDSINSFEEGSGSAADAGLGSETSSSCVFAPAKIAVGSGARTLLTAPGGSG